MQNIEVLYWVQLFSVQQAVFEMCVTFPLDTVSGQFCILKLGCAMMSDAHEWFWVDLKSNLKLWEVHYEQTFAYTAVNHSWMSLKFSRRGIFSYFNLS